MIIICNGAFKSGSTWLFNITDYLVKTKPIPARFLNPNWVNASIHPKQIKPFLTWYGTNTPSHTYISKNHLYPKYAKTFKAEDDIKLLLIRRPLISVINSIYMHYLREKQIKETTDFETFYWIWGRLVLYSIKKYNENWARSECNTHLIEYDDLVNSFELTARGIAQFLGIGEEAITNLDFSRIQQETSKGSLKKRYAEIGGDPNFFADKKVVKISPSIARDIEEIEKGKSINLISRLKGRIQMKLLFC